MLPQQQQHRIHNEAQSEGKFVVHAKKNKKGIEGCQVKIYAHGWDLAIYIYPYQAKGFQASWPASWKHQREVRDPNTGCCSQRRSHNKFQSFSRQTVFHSSNLRVVQLFFFPHYYDSSRLYCFNSQILLPSSMNQLKSYRI